MILRTENRSVINMKILLLCTLGYLTWVPVDSGPRYITITRGRSHEGKDTVELSNETGWKSIVIEIKNYLDDSLVKPQNFVYQGERKSYLPREIKSHSSEVIIFEGTNWWTRKPVSGILAYSIGRKGFPDLQLAIIFSVPALSDNWFGIKFIRFGRPVNKHLYDFMKKDIAWRYATEHPASRYALASPKATINITLPGYVVEAFMTTGRRSRLRVSIKKSRSQNSLEKTYTDNTNVDYDNAHSFPVN